MSIRTGLVKRELVGIIAVCVDILQQMQVHDIIIPYFSYNFNYGDVSYSWGATLIGNH